jgi:hypothetical protein
MANSHTSSDQPCDNKRQEANAALPQVTPELERDQDCDCDAAYIREEKFTKHPNVPTV